MKCSNPNCGHGIGLVSYRRGWRDKRRFCSKKCRDHFTVERTRPSRQEYLVGSYFNWLFANAKAASGDSSRKLARARRPARWQ
jgi:transposase-like protein